MRYPILRSNSKLSFVSQEHTHLGRCFRIDEISDSRSGQKRMTYHRV